MPGLFKHKKKLLLIILVGILTLAAAGAGAAWFFYFKPAGGAGLATAEPPPPLHKAPFQTLWPMGPMEVPLSGRMGERTLKLGFSFDLDSDVLSEEMALRQEEIVEALNLFLAGRSVEEMERSGSKVRLKYETLRLVNGLLAEGRVKGVYITEFLIL